MMRWAGRRAGRRLLRLLLLAALALLYNEYLVYYLVLSTCPAPAPAPATVTAMVVADTHLLGRRNGHWWDKLRREWQMHRAFQTALALFTPDHVFFLGDLFDEGKWCPPAEFAAYVQRFHSLFAVDPDSTKVHVMAGNHDIGFHYATSPYLDTRFRSAFSTETVQLEQLGGNISVVMINSVAFEGDSCFLCADTGRAVRRVAAELAGTRPLLLSHYPLYRKSDGHCAEPGRAPASERDQPFRPGWDCLTQEATSLLLSSLSPRLVLTGHTHHACTTRHPLPRPATVTEHSVPSFSWRNKHNPSFLLLRLGPDTHTTTICFMPDENTVITVYVFFIALAILSLGKR